MENGRTCHSENEHPIWIPRPAQLEDAEEIVQVQDYGSINKKQNKTETFFQTFLISIWTSLTIIIATILVALLLIFLMYFDLNTSQICFEQQQHESTLPRGVMRWVLAGHVVEVMVLHFWFQLFLILIFTWRKFKCRHHALLIAFLQGCMVSLYKIVLFSQNVDFTQDRYRYTGNIVFLLGVIYTGYVVSKKICACRPTKDLKKLQVFKIITTQYFCGCIIVLIYRYLIIPWFISVENETLKAIVAVVVVVPITLPNIINKQVALSSLQFVKPGRNFAFISFFTTVRILLFRIMQADVRSIEIFTALSLYRAVVQVILAATEKLRTKVLRTVCRYLRRSRCCPQRSRKESEDEENNERLKVDEYIQLMLYQNSALIVGQAYYALYIINNFYTKPWDVSAAVLIRIGIGSTINLFSNSVAIFIHVYWHNSKLPTVWAKAWRLHLYTVVLGSAMTIMYFSVVLLTVFQGKQNLPMKNCTQPF